MGQVEVLFERADSRLFLPVLLGASAFSGATLDRWRISEKRCIHTTIRGLYCNSVVVAQGTGASQECINEALWWEVGVFFNVMIQASRRYKDKATVRDEQIELRLIQSYSLRIALGAQTAVMQAAKHE